MTMRKCSKKHPEIYYEVYLDDKPTSCPICQVIDYQNIVLADFINKLKLGFNEKL